MAQVSARLRDRETVRAAKDWAAADRIRDELRSVGVEVGKYNFSSKTLLHLPA